MATVKYRTTVISLDCNLTIAKTINKELNYFTKVVNQKLHQRNVAFKMMARLDAGGQ